MEKTSCMNRVTYYNYQIRNHPLLPFEAELALARRIQRGWHECVVPDGKGKRRVNFFTRDAKRALDELVECNQRLVGNIARRYEGKGLPLSDLIAEGQEGLMRAAVKFDPDRGRRFATYATYWIRQHIQRAVHGIRLVRIPVHLIRDKWPEWKVKSLNEEMDVKSLWVPPPDLERQDLYELALKHLRRICVQRDQQIVLDRMRGATLLDIAQKNGISRERVRQIVESAIEHLRILMHSQAVTVKQPRRRNHAEDRS